MSASGLHSAGKQDFRRARGLIGREGSFRRLEQGRRSTSSWGRRLSLPASSWPACRSAVSALAATQAKLVKDINPSGPSDPAELANVSGTLFFSAYDDDHGTELWKSDGTEAGTKLVKDIRPGGGPSGGSVPLEITSFRGMAFFRAAEDGFDGYELWRSDGTKRGTKRSRTSSPSTGSEPHDFTAIGRTLFFGAHQTVGGYGLWKTDGTKRGTKLVKPFGPSSSRTRAARSSSRASTPRTAGSCGSPTARRRERGS